MKATHLKQIRSREHTIKLLALLEVVLKVIIAALQLLALYKTTIQSGVVLLMFVGRLKDLYASLPKR